MSQTRISNKKVFRDYFIQATWECGVELKGCEVKSVRNGQVSFADSYARVDKGELFIYNLNIAQYEQASYMNVDPTRPRRLLLHKREIKKIFNEVTIKHLALIPTKLYFNSRGFVKIEIGVGKGKKMYDKRETIKKRDIDRDIGRSLRVRLK